jgi:Dyp-type peroxidase family
MQGLIRSAYRTLPHVQYTLFHVNDPAGGRQLLSYLADAVTSASAKAVPVATHAAVTSTGLAAIDLPADAVDGFSFEFRVGMNSVGRSRFLGDNTLEWVWGRPDQRPVHILTITYADAPDRRDHAVAALDAAAEASDTAVVHRLMTDGVPDTEPFGFRDGVSQPFVAELASQSKPKPTRSRPVPLGEFVLGYQNIYGQTTQRPVLPFALDRLCRLRVLPAGDDPGYPDGGADLGHNGSYLVLRSLEQHVATFHDYIAAESDRSGIDAGLLAVKMVGRWPSGAPLTLSPERDNPELSTANEFNYHSTDERGLACPIGAHIRRANPRDSLDPRPGSQRSLDVTDRHRLLRRGRVYNDGNTQGLQFVALNANLGRQFEFVQHSWLNNPQFGGLYDDVDALVASRNLKSTFTIPKLPLRIRHGGLPEFVTTRGGAYFFLPGIRALRYLAEGAWCRRTGESTTP